MENNVILLTESERKHLEKYAKNGVHNAHLITRARTILSGKLIQNNLYSKRAK